LLSLYDRGAAGHLGEKNGHATEIARRTCTSIGRAHLTRSNFTYRVSSSSTSREFCRASLRSILRPCSALACPACRLRPWPVGRKAQRGKHQPPSGCARHQYTLRDRSWMPDLERTIFRCLGRCHHIPGPLVLVPLSSGAAPGTSRPIGEHLELGACNKTAGPY
jgi:hypothetical protein